VENLRVKEAAVYLKINKATLLRYMHAGKIPSFKLSPRIILFKKTDLDEFMNKGGDNG
jgi:excisionase family DNA binding protein